MERSVYVYLLIMALVTYAIRALPLTLLKREIKSRTLRSFLYYVPYVTLSVMTFPAMLSATQTPVSGAAALIAGAAIAWRGGSLFTVALAVCAVVFIVELAMGV